MTTQPTITAESRIIRLGKFIHHDEAAGFLIAVAYPAGEAGRESEMKIKGEILAPMQGESYELHGHMDLTGRYGPEFVFHSARMLLPDSTGGIQRFLARSLDFVGPAVARAITDAYGMQSLTVLRDEPERVGSEISGITPERAKRISEWLRDHEESTKLRVELESMLGGIPDLPKKTVESAIEEWGTDAPAVIRENPYRLTDLPRIGFKRADEIAVQRFGYDPKGKERRKAAMLFALREEAATNGHTVLADRDAIRTVVNLIGYEPGEDAIKELYESGEIQAHAGDVQLTALAEAEATIAERVGTLNSFPIRPDDVIPMPPEIAAEKNDQTAAWAVVNSARVTLLTGAPGTGKTWLVAKIVEAARRAGYQVELGAPTGKAAKRITESLAAAGVSGQGKTIYRMLGATMHEKTGEWAYTYTRGNAFKAKRLFVLDEWSMVATVLAARVFDAVNDDSRVLLVGDPRQLPSIGAGAVLRDMIESGVIPHAELTEIKRNHGDLVKAIHAIKDGEIPTFSERLDLDSDPQNPKNFRMIECGEDEIHATMLDLLGKLDRRGFDPVWSVQVMSPLNEKGPQCCDALNGLLADALNREGKSEKGLPFRVGDKVVCTKNKRVDGQYANPAADRPERLEAGMVEVVNGDLGKVLDIGPREIRVQHWTPDRTAIYARRDHNLRLAYCLTVHKMQGSSAPVTVLPMHRSFAGPIWTREWIYTAISRAERSCILVGDRATFEQAIRRPSGNRRKTRLVGLLRERMAKPVPDLPASEPSPRPLQALRAENDQLKKCADADWINVPELNAVDMNADVNAALNDAAESDRTQDWFDSGQRLAEWRTNF